MSDSATPPPWRTEPVSFTRRGGRLDGRQQHAWDVLGPTMVVEVPRWGASTSVDPNATFDIVGAFGRDAPLIVEIGSGRGDSLVAAATARTDTNFLGVEVYVPGVADTLDAAQRQDVTNLRLAVVNAPEALATFLPAGSVDELWTWFPDPWHKKRHFKRRLITVEFCSLVARVLTPSGTWRIATDWLDYAEWITEVLRESADVDGGPVERFAGRAETRFERKGVRAGREISDFAATPTQIGDILRQD